MPGTAAIGRGVDVGEARLEAAVCWDTPWCEMQRREKKRITYLSDVQQYLNCFFDLNLVARKQMTSRRVVAIPNDFDASDYKHWYELGMKMDRHDVVMLRSPDIWHGDLPRTEVVAERMDVVGRMLIAAEAGLGRCWNTDYGVRSALVELMHGSHFRVGDRNLHRDALYECTSSQSSFRIPSTDLTSNPSALNSSEMP